MCTGVVQVKLPGEQDLQEVLIPKAVKALVVLNLQSYAGGRDLFGLNSPEDQLRKEGFLTPIFNDGLLEVRPKHCAVQLLTVELICQPVRATWQGQRT